MQPDPFGNLFSNILGLRLTLVTGNMFSDETKFFDGQLPSWIARIVPCDTEVVQEDANHDDVLNVS